jgi:hypothetical protein
MLVSGLVRGLGMFFPCRLCFFASSFGREQVRNRGAFCCSALVSSCSWNVCLLPHQGSVAGLADEFGNVETFLFAGLMVMSSLITICAKYSWAGVLHVHRATNSYYSHLDAVGNAL